MKSLPGEEVHLWECWRIQGKVARRNHYLVRMLENPDFANFRRGAGKQGRTKRNSMVVDKH